MAKTIDDAVREVCLSLAQAEEFPSHGSPNFRVRGKTFATYVINHHGDGRVALWLNAPAGSQDHYVRSEPKHFFVPQYVGPRGWLGVRLDKGLSWKRIAALVQQSYAKVAPRALADATGGIDIKPPTVKMSQSDIDPLKAAHAVPLVQRLRRLCLALPESSEGTQFGSPVWRAGKKVFAMIHAARHIDGGGPARLRMYFWVGVAAQGLMTTDPRYEIPSYMGHNGWITLDVTKSCNWKEVHSLALQSYRHFAVRRMLAQLDGQDT